MSLLVFVKQLCEDDLDIPRLTRVWKDNDVKNASPHIHRLMASLHRYIEKHGTIPKDKVGGLCEKYKMMEIKKSIPPSIPSYIVEEDYNGKKILINPQTSLVFREDDKYKYVATGVKVVNKVYPLQLKHMSICVSNGWYFETTNPNISCVFKV
jgi:hypothetical protein